jgi:hypothetical protein
LRRTNIPADQYPGIRCPQGDSPIKENPRRAGYTSNRSAGRATSAYNTGMRKMLINSRVK